MFKRYAQLIILMVLNPMAPANFGSSGLARSLRASALARPTVVRRAFRPVQKNLAPALGARFASGVGDGKIHQVIGAVVDGMQPH